MAQTANSAVFPPWLQSEHPQRLWYNHTLLLVVWWWNTLEDLQTFHSSSTASCLVGNHAAHGLVEDTGGSAEMERACRRTCQMPLRSSVVAMAGGCGLEAYLHE